MNSPLQKLHAVPVLDNLKPSTVTEEVLASSSYADIEEQIADLKAYQDSLPVDKKMKEAVYIAALSAFEKEKNSLLGNDLQIGNIKLTCNAVRVNRDKDGNVLCKDKGRGKNTIKGGGNSIAGGLVTITGTGLNGNNVIKTNPNVEVVKAIAENAPAVLEFLSRPNMKYRYCQQQTVEEGHMSPEELFA